MRVEPARPLEPLPLAHREFLVEVWGPLFGAVGGLGLAPAGRRSDFENEREGFLRLTDVEFATDGDMSARPQKGPLTEYLINKTGIELICQPPAEAIERRSEVDMDYGKSLWQALNKMAVDANADLRVPKERHYVQVHRHRFTVGAYLHLARGASLDAVLSHLPTKFVPVTDATAHFLGSTGEPSTFERKLMLVNRDHILLVAPRGD